MLTLDARSQYHFAQCSPHLGIQLDEALKSPMDRCALDSFRWSRAGFPRFAIWLLVSWDSGYRGRVSGEPRIFAALVLLLALGKFASKLEDPVDDG